MDLILPGDVIWAGRGRVRVVEVYWRSGDQVEVVAADGSILRAHPAALRRVPAGAAT